MRKLLVIILNFYVSIVLHAQIFEKANITNVSVINSSKLDFAPAFYKDGLVFVSNTEAPGISKMYDKRINQKTMSLFIAKKNQAGSLQKPEPFALELVSTVHEGPLSFSNDFNTIYFSRNNNKKGGKAKYVELVDRMQIYISHFNNKTWSKPQRVEFDRETKDFCHPSLSTDGKKLYFSSNRKGGYGGMDLYVSDILPNGKMGKPFNLGSNINTDKNEVFPFIHADGTLYFSSNKLGGQGGLDIYYTHQQVGQDIFANPLSIGAPFNSEKDDFGFILDTDHTLGYFSSNRSGGFGEDDIYSFVLAHKIKPLLSPEPLKTLLVLDNKTKLPIANADIILTKNDNQKAFYTNDNGKILLEKWDNQYNYNIKINKGKYNSEQITLMKNDTTSEIIVLLDAVQDKKQIEIIIQVLDLDTRLPIDKAFVSWQNKNEIITDEKGLSLLYLERGNDYNFKILKENYDAENITFTKDDKRTNITVYIHRTALNPLTGLGKAIDADSKLPPMDSDNSTKVKNDSYSIVNIYYDFDKSLIRQDARNILDSVIIILKKYPELNIDLESHTDSRGTNKYNYDLSLRRTYSASEYLVKRGIAPQRIIQLAQGETMPTNNCTDNIHCDKITHQANRRTVIRLNKNTDLK